MQEMEEKEEYISETYIDEVKAKQIIDEAIPLGLKVISILGSGEPYFKDNIRTTNNLIHYAAKEKKLGVVIFTNGSVLEGSTADLLSSIESITVIVKLNSFNDATIHDELCGINGSKRKRIRKFLACHELTYR